MTHPGLDEPPYVPLQPRKLGEVPEGSPPDAETMRPVADPPKRSPPEPARQLSHIASVSGPTRSPPEPARQSSHAAPLKQPAPLTHGRSWAAERLNSATQGVRGRI